MAYTLIKNNMTPTDRSRLKQFFLQNHDAEKAKIDMLVKTAQEAIVACEPLALLQYARTHSIMSYIGNRSEVEFSEDEIIAQRMVEYIHATFTSFEVKGFQTIDEQQRQEAMDAAINSIYELYKGCNQFYYYWTTRLLEQENIEKELVEFIFLAQNMYHVRGNRYQIFQLEPLKRLLRPHDAILTELFGLTAEDVLTGLGKLEYALSQGVGDAWTSLLDSWDMFNQLVEEKDESVSEESFTEVLNSLRNDVKIQDNLDAAMGLGLNDVKKITGWSDNFINTLTANENSQDRWKNDSYYSGWPIIQLPITEKPFVSINGVAYVFDYYNLFDHFYRIIQKEIKRQKKSYENNWSDYQKQASEEMVSELFLKLLPGASCLLDNYYYPTGSKKSRIENDLMILYEDILLIIEVKAGSFPVTPPISDYRAHIKAYQSLVEKADHQCDSVKRYIENTDNPIFYTEERQEKITINKNEIRKIYTFSVTVDNINSFASRAEKLSFLHLKSNAISISIDDLLSYVAYFDSPLYFLHFLEHREAATQTKELSLNDELDHLGLYIHHNAYPMYIKSISKKGARNFIHGYRQSLDHYLNSLYHPELEVEKPKQNIPDIIRKIVDFAESSSVVGKILLSSAFLNLSTEAKEEIVEMIVRTVARQEKEERMLPLLWVHNKLRLYLFIGMEGSRVKGFTGEQKRSFAYATSILNEEVPLLYVNLLVNKGWEVVALESENCDVNNLSEEEYVQARELSFTFAKNRIQQHISTHNVKKLGRNEACPCGSGRKYKKCCLDR